MTKVEVYRRYAAECVRMAKQAVDPRSKGTLIDMASVWLRLADQAEKNSLADLAYEAPPQRDGTGLR